ncbi:MAG: septum formation initiator family protein [Synergistetes bacterium]|nr:septum formation initiator family protein [Synergistota bacterium]
MLRKWLLYAVIILVLSMTSISIIKEVRKIILFKRRAFLLREKIAELELENKKLREKIKLAKSRFLLEKIIREEYRMARPNEIVIYFREGKGGEGKNAFEAGKRGR